MALSCPLHPFSMPQVALSRDEVLVPLNMHSSHLQGGGAQFRRLLSDFSSEGSGTLDSQPHSIEPMLISGSIPVLRAEGRGSVVSIDSSLDDFIAGSL